MDHNKVVRMIIFILVLGFIISSCKKEIPEYLPTISTTKISDITSNSAVCGGNISFGGNAPITAKGVCWSSKQNPTIADSKTNDGLGTGSYSSVINGLNSGTTYYFRAYATNEVGTAYGNQVIGTTHSLLPTVTTSRASDISFFSFKIGGAITYDGGSEIIERGVCWHTQKNPTINNSKTTNGAGSSSFVATVSSLSQGTEYYVRAYATNSMGTAYGNQESVQTKVGTTPTVSTIKFEKISSEVVSVRSIITDEGNSPVTDRGVCWSTSRNPTVYNSYESSGSEEKAYLTEITGLSYNITYYFRAYSTNLFGTSYGEEISIILYMNHPGPNISDVEGNIYSSVRIGDQTWLKENLRTTRYRNGDTIPNVTDGSSWANLTTDAYCSYRNNSEISDTYGYLYNHYAVRDERHLCPTGWHVPSYSEWAELINYLGGRNEAGGKLKEAGFEHWNFPNTGANNSSGFTALGGVWRGDDGIFYYNVKYCASFWSSSLYDESNAWSAWMWEDRARAALQQGRYIRINGGLSIRCVKD